MNDLVPLLLKHGSLLVFAVTLAARAGAPLPAAPLLVVAGGLGALGQIPLALTAGLSLLANLLGDLVWSVAGRKLGYRVLRVLCRISLSPDTCVRQSEDLFGRWGGVSLVAPIVTYWNCPNDVSAQRAASSLQALGFRNVRVLAGGFDAWEKLRLEKGASGATLNASARADAA